jgi:hypothetical protein
VYRTNTSDEVPSLCHDRLERNRSAIAADPGLGLYVDPYFCPPASGSNGAPVPDDPMNNLRPSGYVRSRPFARFVPSFARYPETEIAIPGLRV